jgi:hypothetical protein
MMKLEENMAKIILFCLFGNLRLQSKRSGRTVSIVSDKQSPYKVHQFGLCKSHKKVAPISSNAIMGRVINTCTFPVVRYQEVSCP